METTFRDPYGDALKAIRDLLASGRFGWGEPLVVKDLSEEIGYSHTPVREALACLAGEGLIDRRRGRGYFFPALTAADVIDLWELEWAYIHAALQLHGPRTARLQKAGAVDAPGFEGLFSALAQGSGNAALADAHALITERLVPIRRGAETLRPDWAPDATDLISAARLGEAPLFLELFDAHHRQRCGLSDRIALHMQRGA